MTEQLTGVTTDGRTETDANATWLKVCGLAATLASIVGSLAGYSLLPARMRIHWSLGWPYFGPEFAPSLVVLAVFPLLVGSVALGSYWLGTKVRTTEEFAAMQPVFTLAAVGTMVVLVVLQASLILVNS